MYTTRQNIESALERSLTDGEASYFTGVLSKAIDAYINRVTGTLFGSVEDTDVYVNGCGTKRLIIPTMWSVTSIKQDETPVDADSYKLFPVHPPYLAITHKTGTWQEGEYNYVVTGKLGYESVPEDITAIATELAVNHFSYIREDGAVIKSERTGDNSVTYADMSSSLSMTSLSTIDSYKRISRSL